MIRTMNTKALLIFVALSFCAGVVSVEAGPKRKAKIAYKAGVKKAKSGDLAGAIDEFAEAVKIDKKYSAAWRDLGLALRYKSRYVEAAAAYEGAVSANKKSASSWHKLGETYLDLHLPGRAIAPLKKALKLVKKKKRGEVKALLARAFSGSGRYKEAVNHYKSLVKKSGSDRALLVGLASAQAKAEQYADAVSTLKKVISLNPSETKAHILMAQCYVEMGKNGKAKSSYAAACDLGHRKSCLKSR